MKTSLERVKSLLECLLDDVATDALTDRVIGTFVNRYRPDLSTEDTETKANVVLDHLRQYLMAQIKDYDTRVAEASVTSGLPNLGRSKLVEKVKNEVEPPAPAEEMLPRGAKAARGQK